MKMSVHIPHMHKRAEADLVYPGRGRTHPEFSFAGALQDVPVPDAAALAEVTRLLLRHGDAHTGRPARVRVASTEETLSLDLQDPECSLGCLIHTDEFSAIASTSGPRQTHLSVDDHGGLHLRWLVPLTSVGVRSA